MFPVEAEFLFSVDNPAFVVRPSEKLGPKKATAIAIVYKPDTSASVGASSVKGLDKAAAAAAAASASVPRMPPSRTGKLTVSCPKQTSSQWVFYLTS